MLPPVILAAECRRIERRLCDANEPGATIAARGNALPQKAAASSAPWPAFGACVGPGGGGGRGGSPAPGGASQRRMGGRASTPGRSGASLLMPNVNAIQNPLRTARWIAVVLAATGALVALSCGGDDGGEKPTPKDKTPATTAAASPTTAATQPAASPSPAASASPSSSPSPGATVTPGSTYVVKSGDTLWDLAIEWGVTVEAIMAANNLANPNELSIGQELKVP